MSSRFVQWRRNLRLRLLNAQGGVCCYCEEPIYIPHHESQKRPEVRTSKGQLRTEMAGTFEHPQRQGDGGGLWVRNIALACQDCNSRRGKRDWLTFKSMVMGELDAALNEDTTP